MRGDPAVVMVDRRHAANCAIWRVEPHECDCGLEPPPLMTPDRRAAAIVYAGGADAYGFQPATAPCSRCGTASPAGAAEECDDQACPLEGDPP
jgi:hypothetical protein